MVSSEEMAVNYTDAKAGGVEALSTQLERLSPEAKGLFEDRRSILAREKEGDLIGIQNQLQEKVGGDWPTMYEMWINDREREQLTGKN